MRFPFAPCLPLLLLTATATHGAETRAAAEPETADLPPSLETRTFDVFLDAREVGTHSFRFEGTPAAFTLRSKAEFAVKIAFVTVFDYEHSATERWEDGCLVRLDSSTDENGDEFEVTGVKRETGFSVETGSGGETYDLDCAWGFAYWNPQLREHSALVNPQDGKLFDVTWTELGERTVTVDGTEVPTRAFALRDDELDITIHYDPDGRWIALDSAVGDGDRTLRYRPAEGDPVHPDA